VGFWAGSLEWVLTVGAGVNLVCFFWFFGFLGFWVFFVNFVVVVVGVCGFKGECMSKLLNRVKIKKHR
jgi:hypothetical protein